MTVLELSDLFDTKLNAFSAGIVKDEYEKSIYLTRAQDIYYDNILLRFEEDDRIADKIDRMLVDRDIDLVSSGDIFGGYLAVFGENVRKILREKVTTGTSSSPLYSNIELEVELKRLSEIEDALKNPYRNPNWSTALRVIATEDAFDRVKIYLHSSITPNKYIVTYAKSPNTIILEDLPNGLTVKGESYETTDFSFSDKDLMEITDIAINLVFADLAPYSGASQQQQQQQ